ncbi:TPA_asm: DUF4102 domain-containing protein, partial [Salmonella enterica subsp. enterica serovar Java]|nr:DUF4102 domain-containing protein [Salmonella enterica]EBH6781153.1 DUF4102 domain-containing protein [Salmonella enterica]EGZ3911465.1 DUF4102 domain-containing protein [Salmonella enterica subsp. enterica serovar Java]HAC6879456.1 DUF4102 domain-containing protein [Salmonella enterica subsp. enterica serovar Java]
MLVMPVRLFFYQQSEAIPMPLTDIKVKNARPSEKPVKL